MWMLCRSSSLLTAPSTSVTSTSSGNSLASTSGLYTTVDALAPARSAARPCRETTCGSPSSRRARPWPVLTLLIVIASLPHQGQVRQELPPFRHLGHRFSFLRQRAGGAHVHALAATGAAFRSPQGSFRSVMTRRRCRGPSRPRCARLRFRRRPARSACTGCSGCGRPRSARARRPPAALRIPVGEVDVRHPQLLRQRSADRSGRWRRRPSRRGCAR